MSEVKKKSTIKDMLLATIEEHIDAQNAKGMKKYEETLDDCDEDDYFWPTMVIEELIDALQYQQKEIGRLKALLSKEFLDYPFSEKEQEIILRAINSDGKVIESVSHFDSKPEPEQSPQEALDSAVDEYKAVSERDEIIEDLQDEINGLKAEIVELEGNRDEWCQVSSDAADEIVRLRALLVRAWEG